MNVFPIVHGPPLTKLQKRLFWMIIAFGSLPLVSGQDSHIKFDVAISGPISDGSFAQPAPKSEPLDLKVLTSHTKRGYVTEAPEIPDLPPVEGMINVTVQRVQDPGLSAPPSPPQIATPINEDSELMQQMGELQETGGDTFPIMLSATVYDHSRSLLTLSPNGTTGDQITAWSNVDFNHYSAFSTFRVTEANGAEREFALFMGIGNEEAVAPDGDQPEIPRLPDLAVGGPSFSVIEGDPQGEAMKILTQLHDLYRKDGRRMEAAFHASEKAYAERKAFLLANPPKPKDIVIRFMEKDPLKTK